MELQTEDNYPFEVEYYEEPAPDGSVWKFAAIGSMADGWDDDIRYDVFMAIVKAAKEGKFDDDTLVKEMVNDVKELDKKFSEDDEMPSHGDKGE